MASRGSTISRVGSSTKRRTSRPMKKSGPIEVAGDEPDRGAEAEARRLAAAGFQLQATVHLRRTIEAADGSEVEVAFTVIRAHFGTVPEGRIQALTHLTPEHMWQERYIAHDNAITGLSEAILAVADPRASAERLARFTGRRALEMVAGAAVALDRGRLTFLSPEVVFRRYAMVEGLLMDSGLGAFRAWASLGMGLSSNPQIRCIS